MSSKELGKGLGKEFGGSDGVRTQRTQRSAECAGKGGLVWGLGFCGWTSGYYFWKWYGLWFGVVVV